ncbi:MAG: thioredoxin family protein [Deltaproteobacteria bacterium]|jgi:peroxiredoxin|nr:thioredoxin family protein [Deltaproteobacteria bacterium]MBW2537948.1 thioredoxin family protein [Deltaproteobacteria bacterium]
MDLASRLSRYALLPLAVAAVAACSAKEPPASTAATPNQPAPTGEAAPAGPDQPAAQSPGGDQAALGRAAPNFSLPALGGGTVRLSEHRGKVVVLEWFNPDCPFVKQAHSREQQLRGLAARYGADGVVWLAINSGAPGKQGHGAAANERGKQSFGIEYPVLLDESGAVGRQYGALRTPHLYVIDPAGTLVYRGALDNTRGGDLEDAEPSFVNYVTAALADLAAGRAVATPETEPYGCSVKYAN